LTSPWPDDPPLDLVLVAGLGVTNTAASRALVRRGRAVVLMDDGERLPGEVLGAELGMAVHHRPSPETVEALVRSADAVLPAPGLPEHHVVFAAARHAGVPVISELDLARRWDDRPVVAVTGTDGKTTVTTLVADMLEESGVPTAAVGNLEVPLVAAIDDPHPACFVVEASSFRLGHSLHFAPAVGTWLNFGPDHLDVHRDLDTYRRAKARIWAEQVGGQTAVANLDDPVVAAEQPSRPGVRVWRFGITGSARRSGAEFSEHGSLLVGPDDAVLASREDLWRDLPHDRSNALAASATALAAGARLEGVRAALRAFRGLPHRVELVADAGGVRWYDDSKATAPHATLAALAGFQRVVLIAGGRNKGLELAELGAAGNVVGVVGIGEAAAQVVAAFPGVPSRLASSMSDAVASAAVLAEAPAVVLLSPGCASFDWYSSYAERGEDFAAEVRRLLVVDGGSGEGR
jgi:UDP-N-acetylmuramoylalanine--D-glutamate ligase